MIRAKQNPTKKAMKIEPDCEHKGPGQNCFEFLFDIV